MCFFRENEKGFTLMEMLVVLVLVGLVLSLAIPSITRLSSSYQKQVLIEEILAELTALRATANQTGAGYWVPLVDSDELAEEHGDFYKAFGYESITRLLSISISAKNLPIVIYPSGYCSGGTLVYVQLSGVSAEIDLAPPYCNRR